MDKIRIKSMLALGAAMLVGINPVVSADGENLPLKVKTEVDRPLIHESTDEQKVVIKIEVTGEEISVGDRMPLNLAIVLDRSGSMSGGKLEQAKQAAEMLVDQLESDDVLSLVVYETEVEVVLSARRIGNRHAEIKRLVRKIQTGGSTALYGGVEKGGKELSEFLSRERINRVILLSDGIANIGPSSNREIARLGSRLAKDGMSVTTIGLGGDYNETLMTALAEASDANYYYVADVETLPEVFRNELGELKSLVARDFKIEIRCPDGVRPIRFLGRPEELKTQTGTHTFGTLAGGQTRELYLECAVSPEAQGTLSEIATVSAEFEDLKQGKKAKVDERTVVVGYTDDSGLAEKSVNQAIRAESVIYANAVETERTIAYADAGDIDASRANIVRQKAELNAVFAAAPASQKETLREEISALEETEKDLESESLSKEQRKRLSIGSFLKRNAK
ncbi:MAG: VWA domain-containing protein [Verrucomicrobiales bacterium]|nr:VWA domain-containing protein [Verrucomicrobiales bacterium]